LGRGFFSAGADEMEAADWLPVTEFSKGWPAETNDIYEPPQRKKEGERKKRGAETPVAGRIVTEWRHGSTIGKKNFVEETKLYPATPEPIG